ncbi:MAG: RNA pyrophosphohydrolase [Gammaproteobacteria bacterium]|nr:RNA pyrophosphohydrolase [Gammaproteobacteria bacterium]
MIDKRGFRSGIAIVLLDEENHVFWAHRFQAKGWQFPQGGLSSGETPVEAMYRELYEEIGLLPKDVEILAISKDWLRYRLPKQMIRPTEPICIGQRQKWFLLRLLSQNTNICFDTTNSPEFDQYRWVNYWYPVKRVIDFKREVYRKGLNEFSSLIFTNQERF